MLINEICELRDKLNKSILTNDYEYTYELSVKLDELIVKYYMKDKESKKTENKNKKKNK